MANASFKSYDDVIYNPETKKYEDAISGEVIPDKFTPSGELPFFYEGANHLIGDIIEINRKGERNEIAEDYEQDIEDAAFEAISNGMSYFFKEVITKKILGNGKKQILADYTNMVFYGYYFLHDDAIELRFFCGFRASI